MITTPLTTGIHVHYASEVWRVESLEPRKVTLRGELGLELHLAISALIHDPTFGVITADQTNLPIHVAHFSKLSTEKQKRAIELEQHVREVITGYKNGQPHPDYPEEPRPPYSEHQSLENRVATKSAELGLQTRQVWRYLEAYQKNGLPGLVDQRGISTRKALSGNKRYLIQALREVEQDRAACTDISMLELRGIVEKKVIQLQERYQLSETPKLPSQPTFNALVKEYTPSLTHHAKRRRSEASRGTQRPFGKVIATRPGQYVLIDISPFDLMALSEIDGSELRIKLVLAIDLFSRAIVAADALEVDLRGVDITSLLLDVVFPTPLEATWHAQASYPYGGVPEHVILQGSHLPEGSPIAGIPVIVPEAVVVDNGSVFTGGQFRDFCGRLGIDIIMARPYKGSDKAQIERLFGTIQGKLAQHLRGYVGPNPLSRGKDVEAYHFRYEIRDLMLEWSAAFYNNRCHSSLCNPATPSIKLTPNEMFDLGVRMAGHVTIPISRDAYYLALQSELRLIRHDGVSIKGRLYDSSVLNDHRGLSSPYPYLKGKWPFLVDARDSRQIFFQKPETGVWHSIPWREKAYQERPFIEQLALTAKWAYVTRGFQHDNLREIEAVDRDLRETYSSQHGKSKQLPRKERNRLAREGNAERVRERHLDPKVSTLEVANESSSALNSKPEFLNSDTDSDPSIVLLEVKSELKMLDDDEDESLFPW